MDIEPQAAFFAGMAHGILALLDGLGGPELLVIGLVVLLLFGSKRMPEIGRGLGRAIREFKRATSSVEENIREVLYEDPMRPQLRPPAQPRAHRGAVVASASAATPVTQATPATSAPLTETVAPESAPAPTSTPSGEQTERRSEDSPERS